MDELNTPSLSNADPMVSVDWLVENIDAPDVAIIDATWSMPGADEPHPNCFIPGTFFDIDKTADQNSDMPHMLPAAAVFETAVREIGINKDTLVVCYDRHGLFSAPRLWWMFRVFGHDNVKVLDGGLPAWIAAGHATVDTYSPVGPGNFEAVFKPSLYRHISDMRAVKGAAQILDARPSGRFDGTAPEPRKGLSSGHMPHSINVPISELKTTEGFLKSQNELRKVFEGSGADMNKPLITTCGSGITACGIAISLARIGVWQTAVYDGSWAEWASSENCPIVKAS